MDFLRQALVGGSAAICNIAIHALIMTLVIQAAQTASALRVSHRSVYIAGVMIAVVSVLMAAHAIEVLVWATIYAIVGAAPEGSGLVYFAFVNYTTLGYGDITPVAQWQLLGPITAMNGILLFGWSTAVIFEVLRRSLELSPAANKH
ncbi:MAG: two pore domain potassium channel family protein [Pseudorhodoplanes sp.]|nr:two pore domain potassium channel family protein [Pseudorhodoplanes sp.]